MNHISSRGNESEDESYDDPDDYCRFISGSREAQKARRGGLSTSSTNIPRSEAIPCRIKTTGLSSDPNRHNESPLPRLLNVPKTIVYPLNSKLHTLPRIPRKFSPRSLRGRRGHAFMRQVQCLDAVLNCVVAANGLAGFGYRFYQAKIPKNDYSNWRGIMKLQNQHKEVLSK